MSFPILEEYQSRFPDCADILKSLPNLYNKKYSFLYQGFGMNWLSRAWNLSSIIRPREKSLSLSIANLSNVSKKTSTKSTCWNWSENLSYLCQVSISPMKINKSLNFLIVWRKMHQLRKSKLWSLLSKDFSALDQIFLLLHSWLPKLRNTLILIKMLTVTSSLPTTDFAIPSTLLKGNSNCSITRPCNI